MHAEYERSNGFHCSRLPLLSLSQISSTSGTHGNVGQINYSAAKSAVVGMTKTIAKEWGAFGVRANTVVSI